MWLAEDPAGRSVKRMLEELDIPEVELRETLRKLDAAGLAKRQKGTWVAIPLRAPRPRLPKRRRRPPTPSRRPSKRRSEAAT